MSRSDLEILQLNLFECVGLSEISQQELIEDSAILAAKCGIAATFTCIKRLSHSDTIVFYKLAEESEDESALTAFLAERGMNLEEMTLHEMIRIKRIIVESGLQFLTFEELETAFNVLQPWQVNHGLDSSWEVADEAQAKLDAIYSVFPPEQQLPLKLKMRESIMLDAIESLMESPANATGQIERLGDENAWDEVEKLLVKYGMTQSQIIADAINEYTAELQQRLSQNNIR